MKVVNDLLNINNMKIVQYTDYFNFSLDSVILSDYVTPRKGDKIIDFCSGNCPVPMILTTKTKDKIYAVELQKEGKLTPEEYKHIQEMHSKTHYKEYYILILCA